MISLSLAFSLAACTLFIQPAILVAINYHKKPGNWFFILFLVSSAAYSIHAYFDWSLINYVVPTQNIPAWLFNEFGTSYIFIGLWLLAEAAPWALWVFLHNICRTNPLHVKYLSLPLATILSLYTYSAFINFTQPVYYKLANIINMALIVLAAYEVINQWGDDLSNTRRKLRSIVLISVVFLVMTIFYIEITKPDMVDSTILLLSRVGAFVGATFIMAIFFHTKRETLEELFTPKTAKKNGSSAAFSHLGLKIIASMETEELFRESNLTLTRLSEKLAIPEYRLRDTVKAELGYENYSRFINSFRIKYAAEKLLKNMEMPVNEVMKESGFKSHPPFHRAFKEAFNCTPIEYREANA